MKTLEKQTTFEETILTHRDSALNLALWLTKDSDEAEDVVQEASLKALKHYSQLRHNAKAWYLSIVRNTFYNRNTKSANREITISSHSNLFLHLMSGYDTPEEQALKNEKKILIHTCINALDKAHYEIIVLREIKNLSYVEISKRLSIPLGTVMSRLARAREKLRPSLNQYLRQGAI